MGRAIFVAVGVGALVGLVTGALGVSRPDLLLWVLHLLLVLWWWVLVVPTAWRSRPMTPRYEKILGITGGLCVCVLALSFFL
jgi:hypothetical protein